MTNKKKDKVVDFAASVVVICIVAVIVAATIWVVRALFGL